MTAKHIITAPDSILKTLSLPVDSFGSAEQRLMDDLRDSMAASRIPAIGLAAIQIGEPVRALIADIANDEYGGGVVEMFNPVVVNSSGLQVFEEGCLSVPEFWAEVSRPSDVTIGYQDRFGDRQEIRFTGLCATVVQHEMDHLEGKLFIDHLSRLRRDGAVRRLKKLKDYERLELARAPKL